MNFLDDMLATRKDKTKPNDKIFGISERQIANRIQAASEHACLKGRYRGHSPRVGMAVDLAIEGYELPAIKQAGGWSSDESVMRYIEPIVATKNPVALREARNDDNFYDAEYLAE